MKNYFKYHNGILHAESANLFDIANQHGTPSYVYSHACLNDQWHAFDEALQSHPHRIFYAVKASSNLAILDLLNRQGSCFDIVSGGELERVLAIGANPDQIVFSGVGKATAEIKRALEVGIHCFNVESQSELNRIQEIAKDLNQPASISLRINPDIDAKSHPHISTGLKENKFGIDLEQVIPLYEEAHAMSHVKIAGIACHLGSQILSLEPLLQALDTLIDLATTLKKKGIPLQHLNLGGGLGVRYKDETPPTPAEYGREILKRLGKQKWNIHLEPGRAIAAPAGVLLTRVEYLKTTGSKHFAIVDCGINDLLRPPLYEAYHEIVPVILQKQSSSQATLASSTLDIVGPICESSDFLGLNRKLSVSEGDCLAIQMAGAYGFCMSSNYNSRPRAAEIMVSHQGVRLIRAREQFEDLIRLEINEQSP